MAEPVTTAGVAALAKAFENLISNVIKGLDTARQRQAELLGVAYHAQLMSTIRRVSEIKNLLYRQRPAFLKDIYVEPMLAIGSDTLSAQDLFALFFSNERIVVTGPAGFGKSVLLKYLCLAHVDQGTPRIPLFLELRKITNEFASDLVGALHSIYNDPINPIAKSVLTSALRRGLFSVILDGFDEVPQGLKDLVEASILDFGTRYPECSLIVSGRRDLGFSSWEQFRVYEIMAMSEQSTVELISRLDYSEDLKSKFILKAIPVLFENRDRSFIQTPLLAVLMLLTYEIYADVPKQMHIFYAHAFETLLRGHDASKSQFKRSLRSDMTDEEFKRAFASFCAMTYSKGTYRFSKDEVTHYIGSALSSISSNQDVETFLDDLVSSVCVVQLEGFEYSFVHRSFQEYFTAVFLRGSPIDVVGKFFTYRYPQYDETVIPMLIDMDRDRIEKEWVLPNLRELLDFLGREISDVAIGNLLAQFWVSVNFSQSQGDLRTLAGPRSQRYRHLVALERMYVPEADEFGAAWIDDWAEWHNRVSGIVDAIGSGEIPGRLVYVRSDAAKILYDPTEHDLDQEDVTVVLDPVCYPVWERVGMVSVGEHILSYYVNLEASVGRRVELRDRFVEEVF